MSIPEKKPAALSLEEEIRALLAEGRISDAKRLVDGAGDLLPPGSTLREIFHPVIRKLDMRDVDRTGEYRWLKENGRNYRGKWVAVAGESLVLATDSLKELLVRLKDMDTPVEPLIHHIG
ncbi:MAG TPA: hypothetical protein VFR31_13250 [Thermoanaerobaculia bacterium]|nr:hypothetical protein [Thermoanaerobaculia bacterium]